jgi:hypothetical protein
MAHHDHRTTGNGKDLIGRKNSLPHFRRSNQQFEAGLRGTRPAIDGVHPIALRRNPWSVFFTWAVIAVLFFPVLSVSDDFHVCQFSLESLANPAQPFPGVSSVRHGVQDIVGVYCAACVWSSFENASPANPLSLDPASNYLVTDIPTLLCPPILQILVSTADRAPPFA